MSHYMFLEDRSRIDVPKTMDSFLEYSAYSPLIKYDFSCEPTIHCGGSLKPHLKIRHFTTLIRSFPYKPQNFLFKNGFVKG